MGLPFYNLEDVKQKLDRSICLYKGHPYYVRMNQAPNIAALHTLGVGNVLAICVEYTDPNFNYKDYELGYMNVPHILRAIYVSRLPERRVQQALTAQQITAEASPYFATVDMENCLLGKHPDFKTSIDMLYKTHGMQSVAFHRHAAVARRFGGARLMYRGQVVGNQVTKPLVEEPVFQLIPGESYSILLKIFRKMGVAVT